MKKFLLTAATSICALNAQALDTSNNDINAKLLGRFNFEAAGLTQSGLKGDEKYVTSNRKNFGTDTSAFVGVRAEAENDCMKYGAQIGVATTTRQSGSPAYERSHIFTESDYGKLELGSNYDAASTMKIDALTYARATGDNAEKYAMLDIKTANNVVSSQPIFPATYLTLDGSNKERARKVTYYSPKFAGLQFGVSYIPDTGNVGSLKMKTNDHTNKEYIHGGKNYSEPQAMKDVITGGVSFEHHFNEDTNVKLALTSEYGKSAKNAEVTDGLTNVTTKYKMANLRTYNVGAVFTKGSYSLVGSYTDWDKTGTSKEVFGNNRKTKYYSAGAVYKNGPVGLSLSYYKSDKHKNKMDTYVLGTDYLLAPGLMPYAEIAWFNGKGSLPNLYNDTTKRKYKGTAFILGMNMSF